MVRNLTDEEKEKVINFGAFSYDPKKIANITGWNESDVAQSLKDPDSEFFALYQKGKDAADYVIDMKLFEMAKSGDLQALQKFEFRKKTRK